MNEHHWNWKKDIFWGLGLTVSLIVLYEVYKYYVAQQAANANAAANAASQVASNDTELNAQIAALGSNSGSSVDSLNALSGDTGPNISSASQIAGIDSDSLQSLLDNILSYTSPTPTAPAGGQYTVATYNPPLPSAGQQTYPLTYTPNGSNGAPVTVLAPVLTAPVQQALPGVSHS